MVLEFIVFVVENTDLGKFQKELSHKLNHTSKIQKPAKIDVSYSTSYLHDEVYMYSALITMSQPRIDYKMR